MCISTHKGDLIMIIPPQHARIRWNVVTKEIIVEDERNESETETLTKNLAPIEEEWGRWSIMSNDSEQINAAVGALQATLIVDLHFPVSTVHRMLAQLEGWAGSKLIKASMAKYN